MIPTTTCPPASDDSSIGNRHPRPILPNPHDTSTSTVSAHGLPLPKSSHRQRKNVAVACDQCKLRRVKCDGHHPCTRCIEKQKACSYEQADDRRRHRGSSDEAQALTEQINRYRQFIRTLRLASPESAVRILHHLNSFPGWVTDEALLCSALQFAESLQVPPPTPESALHSPASSSTRPGPARIAVEGLLSSSPGGPQNNTALNGLVSEEVNNRQGFRQLQSTESLGYAAPGLVESKA
ncbi:hypothetical protein ABEF95_008334 [Exophiala dermatitidis]